MCDFSDTVVSIRLSLFINRARNYQTFAIQTNKVTPPCMGHFWILKQSVEFAYLLTRRLCAFIFGTSFCSSFCHGFRFLRLWLLCNWLRRDSRGSSRGRLLAFGNSSFARGHYYNVMVVNINEIKVSLERGSRPATQFQLGEKTRILFNVASRSVLSIKSGFSEDLSRKEVV